MTFQNGYKGVKKVFAAEILGVISAVIAVVAAVLAVAAIAAVNDSAAEAALATGGLAGILLIIVSVLSIIAMILKLVGLGQAGKDEPHFKSAFILSIFSLILSVVTAALRVAIQNSAVDEIVDLIVRIFSIVVVFFVVAGVRNFAEQLGDDKMASKGNTLAWIIALPYLLSGIAGLIQGLFGANPETTNLALTIGLIGSILSLIGSIVYLVYLGQAKRMLREN